MNTYFVYQNWTSEKLYKANLTEREADKAYSDLERLLKNGIGKGCACIGNTADDDDYCIAKRLGLL